MPSQSMPCTDMHYTLVYIRDDARKETLAKGSRTLTDYVSAVADAQLPKEQCSQMNGTHSSTARARDGDSM